jgi:hypothetical protein
LNTGAKGLLEIAKKLMNVLTIPSKHFALVFDFSALLGDNLKLIEILSCIQTLAFDFG